MNLAEYRKRGDIKNHAIVKFNDVNDKIIIIRNEKVLLDSNVAELYGVETRDIGKKAARRLHFMPVGSIPRYPGGDGCAMK